MLNFHPSLPTPCLEFSSRRLQVHQRGAMEIQELLQKNKHSEGDSLEV